MVVSVQAQLTDNSWLLSESCRLTGGFALVNWLRTGQFVLTVGGYHPSSTSPRVSRSAPGAVQLGRLAFGCNQGEATSPDRQLCDGRRKLEVSYDTSSVWASLTPSSTRSCPGIRSSTTSRCSSASRRCRHQHLDAVRPGTRQLLDVHRRRRPRLGPGTSRGGRAGSRRHLGDSRFRLRRRDNR
jgi:hypothetical protein